MSRFGLPSFKLLVAGALAAGAVAYYMGEFPDRPAKGARTTQPAVKKAVRPAKPVAQQRVPTPASRPLKAGAQPRPTQAVGVRASAKAPTPAKPAPSPEKAKANVPQRPAATLTGSIVKPPRPPADLPVAKNR